MAMTKVWNDNKHPHKEMFKGVEIVIPPGKSIEMEYEEAVEFKGQYTPMPPDEFNGDESIYYKKIRVEPVDPRLVVKDPNDHLINHATGKSFESVKDLAASLEAVRHLLVKDPDAERALAKADSDKDAKIQALSDQVAELSTLVKGKKPAPGPKGAAA